PDSYNMVWNTQLNVFAPGVLTNDTDADGDPLTAELVTSTTHGTLNFLSTGAFSYTPNAFFFGTDTFTYRVRDPYFTGNTVTVSILVEPQPIAGDDSYSAYAGRLLQIGAPGVLWNDVDQLGLPLFAQLVGGAQFGAL